MGHADTKRKEKEVVGEYLHAISVDEVRHASLAWIAVRWMMDQNVEGKAMDIADLKWWYIQLQSMHDGTETDRMKRYVYQHVIPSILDKIWMGTQDYALLYDEVNELM